MPIRAFTTPIRAFTMRRSWRSPSADPGVHVRAKPAPGQALTAVMRKARKLTRHHLRERGKRWALEEE
jgi:hypothetical protein